MVEIYNFVVGPLAWVGWGIFVVGIIYKLIYMYSLARAKDYSSLDYMSLPFSLRSIFVWSIPFYATNWKRNPAMTVATFLFHICLIAVPVFLLAHVVLWQKFFGITWATLPDQAADYMTLAVIAACVFFGVRRATDLRARYVTSYKDWLILILVASPFVTGFLAYHQIFNYKFMIILHIVSGLAWLALIPFTRLSHMFLGLFTRAYAGSEFGKVRHVKDW
ncbi:MAG: nitrate reductase [Desulfovibrionaceae bacterium]|nr:nitrate reductase [Desulfovibrionaceae bacterium]MDD4952341.1 nitrate reductase [Desulfovibrionaceae bacterium]